MFTNTTIGLGPIVAFGNATIGPTKKLRKDSNTKKKKNKGPIAAFTNTTIGHGPIAAFENTTIGPKPIL